MTVAVEGASNVFDCSVGDKIVAFHNDPDIDALCVATVLKCYLAVDNEGAEEAKYIVQWEDAPQTYTEVKVSEARPLPVEESASSAEPFNEYVYTGTFDNDIMSARWDIYAQPADFYTRHMQEANYQPPVGLQPTLPEPCGHAQNPHVQRVQQPPQARPSTQAPLAPLIPSGFMPMMMTNPLLYYQPVAAPSLQSDGCIAADEWEGMAKRCAAYAEQLRKTQQGGSAGSWWKASNVAPIMRQFEAPVPPESGFRASGFRAAERSPNWKSETCRTQAASSAVLEEDKTTIVLRNLPLDYKYQDLLKLLNQHGFDAKYDFVYLPMDFNGSAEKGFGYAFINLTNHEFALQFRNVLTGFTDRVAGLDKALDVQWSSPFQGRDANVERYRNSPVMHALVPRDRKPHIFKDGVEIRYPSPTQSLRPPPRMKHRNSGSS